MKKSKTSKTIFRLIKKNGIDMPFLFEDSKPSQEVYNQAFDEITGILTFLNGQALVAPRLQDFYIKFDGGNVTFNFYVQDRGYAEVRGMAHLDEKKAILKEFGRYVV